MKCSRYLYVLITGFVFVFSGAAKDLNAQSVQSYPLKLVSKKGTFHEKMTIRPDKDGYTVEYTDAAGGGSRNSFTADSFSRQVVYLDANGAEFMRLDFDNSAAKIVSSGQIQKSYELEGRVFDGNGSLFYVFSRILPEKNSQLHFNLLQSKEKRIVKMYIKYLRTETILTGSGKVEADLYETGLVSRVLSLFWPYKYHYWYDAKTRQFLKYEGPVGHENSEIIAVE